MTDVIADRVMVILEAEDQGKATVKAWGDQYDRSQAQVEKAAVRGQKAVEASASAQARAVERASAREQKALEETARKLAAQRRNQALTIQYTANDVIASLSSGANPLTILAQQGGQVTQAFGGLSGTLKALAPVAFSATGALTAAGIALGAAVLAAEKADADFADLENSVIGLGRASGVSAQGLRDIAEASASAGNVSRASAEEMAIAYANTGEIGGKIIGDLITITDDYARATGVDAKEATKALGAAFADPTKGAELLQKQFGLLDAKTLALIKSMQDSGDTAGAQALLFDRLSFAIDGQSEKVGGLKAWWDRLTRSISDAAAAARDYGKAQVEADQRAQARALGGVPLPAGETERQANRAAFRRASLARRNRLSTQAAEDIESLTPGGKRRAEYEAQIARIQRSIADGTVSNLEQANKAIAAAKKELASISRGFASSNAEDAAARKALGSKADQQKRKAIAEGRYSGSPGTDRGVQSIALVSANQYSVNKLRDFKPGIDPTFKAAADAFDRETATEAAAKLQSLQQELYDNTYQGIRGGLQAGFEKGLPGVLEYFTRSLQTELLDGLARGLTDLVRGARPGGSGSNGGLFSSVAAIGASIFGRANGGNVVAGRAYQVNEGRPEVFVPPVSGRMVPLSRLGGGSPTIINQNYSLGQGNLVTERVYADFQRMARTEAVKAGFQSYAQAMRDAPAAVAKKQQERG
ncbi:MAG: phage tail length tape measure family protein [Caulobacter sp.]|nr:phage tail length tape measure family protein [Caulobacter sp.]